jgi:predicted Zn-dependent protease
LFDRFEHIVIKIGIILIPFITFAQEDVASREAMLVEQQNINFQTFFFEALQQKAIGNYDKAIYALEACKNIDKESVAILFEISKNYVFLSKFTEAEYYILKGLEIEPLNLYLLRHLKEIKTKQNDYNGAIIIQNKIIKLKPEEESDLVILYIKSGEIENAISLLKKLDKNNKLPEGLISLKESLLQENPVVIEKRNNSTFKEQPKSKTKLLKEDYKLKKDYNSLKLLLDRELKTKQYLELLKDSEHAISLFPAQAYVYLMNGIALNNTRNYKEAIKILDFGLEYLIEDDELKAQFMDQLSLSYKGLGDNKISSSYYKKALELRNK